MTKDKLRKIIGENIRNERISRNLSIDELAELLGLTTGFVGLIERGKRGATAHTLYRLSKVLDLPLDRFFLQTYGSMKEDASGESGDKRANPVVTKRSKLNALVFDMDETELDFVISVVKSFNVTINKINKNAETDLADEDE